MMHPLRSLIMRFHHRNDDSWKIYKMLKRSQYWTKEQLEAFQLDSFRKLWKHCVDNVPYYSGVARQTGVYEINDLKDIRKLPVLTKDIVREHFDEFVSNNISRRRFLKNSTSGSTGKAFYFYTDLDYINGWRWALELRKYDMMHISKFDRELVIWGAKFDVDKANEGRVAGFKRWLSNYRFVSEYNLSDDSLCNICKEIMSYKPVAIKSYPSILYKLCLYASKHDFKLKAKAVHTGGEKMYAYQKALIEKTFDCPVYDFYGGRDISHIGMSCDKSSKLHIFQENAIFEVVDKNNQPVQDGEGEILITKLHEYAFPLIRYQCGDMAKVSGTDSCACERNLQMVDEIIGRTFDVIEFPNGNRVGGTFWTLLFREKEGIDSFQVVQEDETHITIKYVMSRDAGDFDFDFCLRQIMLAAGDELVVNFQSVEQIPLTKAGKMQFVISNLSRK